MDTFREKLREALEEAGEEKLIAMGVKRSASVRMPFVVIDGNLTYLT
ncbi:MAG: hypothetical protein J7L91_05355 [Candidatus Korarchaeota archaeon]|nr:hypothetical protein [Candidatus Korarchaeota archaeon]